MLARTTLGIKEGKIAEIRKNLDAAERMTLQDVIVIPGACDLHVHFREPGLTDKEDIESGSRAAAFGGVTFVADMPNTVPPTTTVERARRKLELFSEKSYVDFGIYGALVDRRNVKRLAPYCIGFKLYMSSTTGELLRDDHEEQRALIENATGTGRLVAVHAEEESLRNRIREENLRDHYRARKPECEISAVRRLASISDALGRSIHIAHATMKETVEAGRGSGLTFEVTPHHLLLDCDMPIGAAGKVNPPLRRREDRAALMKLFSEGGIDTLGSDHAPHTIEEKRDDFDYAPVGIPGVETMLPLLLHQVATGEIRLSVLVRAACERPAEIAGIKKGKIAVGYDADLVAVNLKKIRPIRGDLLHSKCGWTPFEGYRAVFPDAVLLRGTRIVEGGAIVSERIGRRAG